MCEKAGKVDWKKSYWQECATSDKHYRKAQELAARNAELEQRVKVLTDAIQDARNTMTLEQNFYSRTGQILEAAINHLPKESKE